jgi:hypothetical protein
MKRLGVILSAYALEEYVKPCLTPWLSFDIPVSCASFQFEGFERQDNERCINELKSLLPTQNIFYDNNIALQEHDARNIGLNYLKNNTDVDTFLILDIDEFYTESDIEFILKYINDDDFNWVAWAKINFKNYIFNQKSWTDGFCPPRIFKANYRDFKLDKFYWDNDLIYKDNSSNQIDYKSLSSAIIPKHKLHIRHITWLDNVRSKNKVEYQEKHFGKCSFKWNDETNKLEINSQYYRDSNQAIPQIFYDE